MRVVHRRKPDAAAGFPESLRGIVHAVIAVIGSVVDPPGVIARMFFAGTASSQRKPVGDDFETDVVRIDALAEPVSAELPQVGVGFVVEGVQQAICVFCNSSFLSCWFLNVSFFRDVRVLHP